MNLTSMKNLISISCKQLTVIEFLETSKSGIGWEFFISSWELGCTVPTAYPYPKIFRLPPLGVTPTGPLLHLPHWRSHCGHQGRGLNSTKSSGNHHDHKQCNTEQSTPPWVDSSSNSRQLILHHKTLQRHGINLEEYMPLSPREGVLAVY